MNNAYSVANAKLQNTLTNSKLGCGIKSKFKNELDEKKNKERNKTKKTLLI